MKPKSIAKIVLIIFSFLMLSVFLYFVLVPWSNDMTFRVHGQLFVNKRPIGDKSVIIYRQGSVYFAEVPLTVVLDSMGYRVAWQSTGEAQIEINGKTLFLVGNKIVDSNSEFVCQLDGFAASLYDLEGPPGEIYMKVDSLKKVLPKIGADHVQIEIDPKSRTVQIATG